MILQQELAFNSADDEGYRVAADNELLQSITDGLSNTGVGWSSLANVTEEI